jgi:hypothetical protein
MIGGRSAAVGSALKSLFELFNQDGLPLIGLKGIPIAMNTFNVRQHILQHAATIHGVLLTQGADPNAIASRTLHATSVVRICESSSLFLQPDVHSNELPCVVQMGSTW